MFGAVRGVTVTVSLRYGVGLLGVRRGEHPLPALPQSLPNTSICSLEGALLQYGSGGDQVHCRQNEAKLEETQSTANESVVSLAGIWS